MIIGENALVEFHYDIFENGKLLESSKDGEPMSYIHGVNAMLPGVEKALEGRKEGDEFAITLTPPDAYGEHIESQIRRVSVSHLIHPDGLENVDWQPGMVGILQTDDITRQVTVVGTGKKTVECDFNHPFAGKILDFKIKIIKVRTAIDAELRSIE